MVTLELLRENIMEGQAPRVKELIQTALDEGFAVEKILNEGLLAAMSVIGAQFKNEEIYLPEVLLAARAMLAGMQVLEPLMLGAGVEPLARVVLGSVQGDIHDIGKNLVGIMFKGAGFEVIDLGVDVPPEKFIEAAQEGVQLIGMSALISTTIPMMKTTLDALQAAGVTSRIKIMVGGAIVTQAYADRIGADGYAPDAVSAVAKAKELLGLG